MPATGEQLELEIVAAIRRNDDGNGLYGSEVIQAVTEWGDPAPWFRRIGEQAIARLVKRGALVEDKATDPNGLALYRLGPGAYKQGDRIRFDNGATALEGTVNGQPFEADGALYVPTYVQDGDRLMVVDGRNILEEVQR